MTRRGAPDGEYIYSCAGHSRLQQRADAKPPKRPLNKRQEKQVKRLKKKGAA